MVVQEAQDVQRYPPPAEQASAPDFFRSTHRQSPQDWSSRDFSTGGHLSSDFSLGSHALLEPSLSPALDSKSPSETPWGVIAAGLGFVGYEAASMYASRRSKHPWSTFGLTQAVGAVGLSCLGQAGTVSITEQAPVPTLGAEVISSPNATQTSEPSVWTESFLKSFDGMVPWQNVSATESGWGVPFVRESTDVANYPDGTVKLYKSVIGGDEKYAFGMTSFVNETMGTMYASTLFYGTDTTKVGMLAEGKFIDEATSEWKVIQMVEDKNDQGNVINRHVEVDPSFTILIHKVDDKNVTFTVKSSSGEEEPLMLAQIENQPTPTASPTNIPFADYNAVFNISKDQQLRFVTETGSIDAFELKDPLVKEALEGTDYTVSSEGEPVIRVQAYSYGVEVPGKFENVTLVNPKKVETTFSGAEVIQYGYNKKDEKVRYVFVENSGWIRYVEGGTVENPTEIPADYVDTGVLNRLTALKYYENPTMPETETKPKYEFDLYNAPDSGVAGDIQLISDKELFNYFDYQGVYKLRGKDIYVLPINYKNPTEGNQKQLTNVFGGLPQIVFDHLKNDIKSQNTGESILSGIINHKFLSEPWLWIRNNHLDAYTKYSDVLNLYPPGTILQLFPQDDFDAITFSITKRENNLPLSNNELKIILHGGIPVGLSEKIVPLMFNNVD